MEASDTRPLAAFDSLDIGAQIHATWQPGEPAEAVVTGDDNLLEFVRTDVAGGTLDVGLQNGSYRWKAGPARVDITGPQPRSIDLGGQSRLSAEGIAVSDLAVDGGGQAKMTLDVQAETLVVDLGGQSVLTLTGTVGTLTLDLGGQSRCDLSGLQVQTLRGDAGGQSRVTHAAGVDASIETSAQASVRVVD